MARPRALDPSPIALIGGVLVIISSFLPWDDVAGLAYDDSFKVPFQLLWDKDASGGFKLGIPLVIVAAAVALLSVSPITPLEFLRRLGGVLLLAAVALFVVQLGRRVGWDNLGVGVGPYLAGAGALLALLAPSGLWPVTRGRPRRAPARPAAPPPPPPDEAPPIMPAAGTPIREERVSATGTAGTGPSTGRIRHERRWALIVLSE